MKENINHDKRIDKKADIVSNYFLALSFLFGLVLAFFNNTYIVAITIGIACLLLYYVSKLMFSSGNFYQYVYSFILSVFTIQYQYQMNGLIEIYFYVFIGSLLLIFYQNWKLQLPLAFCILMHYVVFCYLQYAGKNQFVFFAQNRSDVAIAFHIILTSVIFGLSGYWSYVFRVRTMENIFDSTQLNNQLDSVQKNISFAEEISKGNLSSVYEHSEGDPLGESLMTMRGNLIKASDKDRQDKYVNIGFAKAADILRNNNDNIEELSNNIIAFIVQYLDANQGGLFIAEHIEGMEDYLELKACYAYNRKKYIDKKILVGEGLIGQCYLEKETIFMTEIPNSYISITSGLGAANPTCIVIIPLKVNNVIYGVIEIASFIILEKYQVEFVEKLGESIASTISNTKINQNTKKLLEESQEQSEMLRSQEEEMRQNMEELSATQEEMERNNDEIRNRMEAINSTGVGSIEFDMRGNVITANNSFLELMGYKLEEIKGKHHSLFVSKEYKDSTEYNKFWMDLKNEKIIPGEHVRVTKAGDIVYIKAAYAVIKNKEGVPERILKLLMNIQNNQLQRNNFN